MNNVRINISHKNAVVCMFHSEASVWFTFRLKHLLMVILFHANLIRFGIKPANE